MKNNLLNIKGIEILSKENQKEIKGRAGWGVSGWGNCGCDCAGRVTGPPSCYKLIACPQVYTCDEYM